MAVPLKTLSDVEVHSLIWRLYAKWTKGNQTPRQFVFVYGQNVSRSNSFASGAMNSGDSVS
jgi:hypothetical protein